MRRIIFFIILSVSVSLQAQTVSFQQLVTEHEQKSFPESIPAGNFSGITTLGKNLYAVVDDKRGDGFYVFRIKFNPEGDITSIQNLGFRGSGLYNRNDEGIVYVPSWKTVFISGEEDNKVLEYDLKGRHTGRMLDVPEIFKKAKPNLGLEALAYNANTHLFWTTSESPLTGDSTHVLCSFNENLQFQDKVEYVMDAPSTDESGEIHVHGVSEMTALDDGSLLILEREAYVPKERIGAWAICKIYQFFPHANVKKQLIHEWKTDLSLFHQDFANYEGMCLGPKLKDGSQVILLVADSQEQYKGVLSDWFKTLVIRRSEPNQ